MSTLQDKIFISTCTSDKASKLRYHLNNRGAKLVDLQMIEIERAGITENLKYAFDNINLFDWIIFTSSHGVSNFFELMKKHNHPPEWSQTIKFATIGKATSSKLMDYGVQADFVSMGNRSKKMVREMTTVLGNKTRHILHPAGNLTGGVLAAELGKTHKIFSLVVYKTVPVQTIMHEVLNKIYAGEYDLIFFFSPSAFRNFISIIKPEFRSGCLRIACIGKTTERAVQDMGYSPLVVAQKSDIEGMIKETEIYYEKQLIKTSKL